MFGVDLAILCVIAFFAGLMDSIAGGGGLIQIPALLVLQPQLAIATVFGTNKMVSVCGVSTALWRLSRKLEIPWHSMLPAAVVAMLFSFWGAHTVASINPEYLKPLILFLLIAVALFTMVQKNFGVLHAPKWLASKQRNIAVLIGAVLGFYEGFFGPGTGSFLIFAFVGLLGFDFLAASASAKLINTATNAAALAYFALNDNVVYQLALPMAVFNVVGSWVGAHLALANGVRFIRPVFIVVMCALIIRFAYDLFLK
jgi:uncharacterized protein